METRITQAWFPARGLHLNRFFPPHLAHGFQPPFSPATLLRIPEASHSTVVAHEPEQTWEFPPSLTASWCNWESFVAGVNGGVWGNYGAVVGLGGVGGMT